jgi:hypothetical protein
VIDPAVKLTSIVNGMGFFDESCSFLVFVRDGSNPELPKVRERNVEGGEALVRRVSVAAHSQKVNVAMTDPRNLEFNSQLIVGSIL